MVMAPPVRLVAARTHAAALPSTSFRSSNSKIYPPETLFFFPSGSATNCPFRQHAANHTQAHAPGRGTRLRLESDTVTPLGISLNSATESIFGEIEQDMKT